MHRVLIAFVIGGLASIADAAELKALHVATSATGTRAELRLDSRVEPRFIRLSNPSRLVVDLPGTQLRPSARIGGTAGIVRSVRSGQPEPGVARIVFDLAQDTVAPPPRWEHGSEGPRLVIEWPGDEPAPPVARAPAASSVAMPAAASGVVPAAPTVSIAPPPSGTLDTLANALATASTPAPLIAPVAVAPAPPAGVIAPPRAVASSPAAVAVRPPVATTRPPAATTLPAPTVRPSVPSPQPMVTPGQRNLVIAIDAGHGGQDTGAIGMGGTREKDITLQVARELARQINARPGLRAFLTRDTDVFIPLPQRARRATAAKADLFVSIHADAAENRNAKGASVYILSMRGASSQRARWLADKENASDVIGGAGMISDNVLTNVLLDLTQSGNMRASEDAASHVLDGLRDIGNMHKHDVERANFAVLRTSDKMPAMLVETAFISNPDEERRLRDPDYQRQLATGILGGIHRYFSRQPPPGTLYAARAANDASQPKGGSTGGAP